MLTAQDFVTCLQDNLKAKGFGKKRIKELTDEYKSRAEGYKSQGRDSTDAALLAQRDVFTNLSDAAKERAKRTAKMLALNADNIALVRQGHEANTSLFLMDGKPGSKGVALARAAVARLESDPRFQGGSYAENKDVTRGLLYSFFGLSLEEVGKGAFGRQLGKAHLPNAVREIKGVKTGDRAAADLAKAWLTVQDVAVDMFNAAGGSMRKLKNYLPQSQNAVRMVKAGEDVWVKQHLDWVDWNATRWPSGERIPVGERENVLRNAFRTMTTDGANKIDKSAFRGQGRSVGNMLENHRFLHYKNDEAWIAMHEAYGDGNIFDTMVRHIEDLAHRISVVETFGPNPQMTANNLKAIVRAEAGSVGAKELADAEAVLKNKFDPIFETVMRENPMDPHSTYGALVTGAANILTSAQLGSAALLAIPGDFMQTAAVRKLNNMGLFDGVGTYVKALATDQKFQREIATQSGFIMDEVVMATYAQSRFTGVATVGPMVSRRVSEAVMRLSLLAGHTRSARWAVQSEFMGLMQRNRNTAYEDLPYRRVFERHGITKDDWNALRANTEPWSPRKDVQFMRPIDLMESDLANKQELFRKFQGMIYDESKTMVPEATLEGAATLRGTSRPDTLVGSLLYSFAMYKNFPVSFIMIYGRLGMMTQTPLGRVGFYAGLGAGMTMVGALGTQMREISKGRDPLPMDSAAFLGKSFLSGGALSIWGDFLFAGVNEFGRGPEQIAAGPLVGLLGDTSDLVLGDVFQVADSLGSLDSKEFKSSTAAKTVEFAKRYTPGSSIWWARAALQRQVFDRLQELADPQVYAKRRRQVRAQQRDFGNDYWWAPGSRTPNAVPAFGG